jgi:ABC-type transport system substrate-binding protein
MFQIGQTMADAAKGVGIRIDRKSLPGSAFWDTYAIGDYDFSNHWLRGMDYDPIQVFGGVHPKNDKPIGTCVNSSGDKGSARFKNADLDKVLDQLDTIGPDDAAAQRLCDKALDLCFTNLPCCPSIEQVAPMLHNTTYHTGGPTTRGQETIPGELVGRLPVQGRESEEGMKFFCRKMGQWY